MRTVLEMLGLGVSVLSGVTAVWALVTAESFPLAVLAVFVCLVATVTTITAVVALRRLERLEHLGTRESRWILALPMLAESVGTLGTFSVASKGLNDDARKKLFSDAATRVCLSMAGAFSQVVGRECRVSIKETYLSDRPKEAGEFEADFAVKELASSSPRPSSATDWVSENTDFNDIFRGDDGSFFCNDLPGQLKRGYRNSHWTPDKLKQWASDGRYPYQSTIVWAVRTLVEDPAGEVAWSQVGFLCVDTALTGAFHNIDVAFGDIVARSLYTVWAGAPLPASDEIPSEVPA
jgi:hypothetical protein